MTTVTFMHVGQLKKFVINWFKHIFISSHIENGLNKAIMRQRSFQLTTHMHAHSLHLLLKKK